MEEDKRITHTLNLRGGVTIKETILGTSKLELESDYCCERLKAENEKLNAENERLKVELAAKDKEIAQLDDKLKQAMFLLDEETIEITEFEDQ